MWAKHYQQSSTVRARPIFIFGNIVQRIDADVTKKIKTLFSLKKYLFSRLYSDREREKKKNVPPLIIWQACRHSHTWKALTGSCLQGQHRALNNPFSMNLCRCCSAGTHPVMSNVYSRKASAWEHALYADEDIKTGTLSVSSLPGSFPSYIRLWPFFSFLVSLQGKKKHS